MFQDSHQLLLQFLDKLPFEQRHVVVAREICEISFEKIAEECDMPVSAVSGHYLAGMRVLHAEFERWQATPRDSDAWPVPSTLEALFATVRTAPCPPLPAEQVERGLRRIQERIRALESEDSPPASGPRPGRERHLR